MIGQIKELRAAEEDNAASPAQLTTQLLRAIGDVSEKAGLFRDQVSRFGKLDNLLSVADYNITVLAEKPFRQHFCAAKAHTAAAKVIERLQSQLDTANANVAAMREKFENEWTSKKRLVLEVEKIVSDRDRIASLEQDNAAVADRVSDVQKKLD